MARRGKTKLKGGPDQAPMQRALEQGEGAVHRASESLRNQINTDMDANLRIAEKVGQGISSAQATVERREKEAKEDLRYRQAQDFKRQQHADKTKLAQDRIGLEAKKAGYDYDPEAQQKQKERQAGLMDAEKARQAEIRESGPGKGGLSGQGESTAWADELGIQTSPEQQAEMARARQRREEQMSKPLDPTFTMTPEGQAAQRAKIRQRESQLDIQRMNALSRQRNAQASYNRALHAKDKESMKRHREVLQSPIRSATGALDSVMQGKAPSGSDMKWLLENSEGHPVHETIRSMSKGVAPMRGTPENEQLVKFLNNQIDLQAVDFMEKTGESPDPELVDWTSNIMQNLAANISYVGKMVKSTGMGVYSGVQKKEDKVRLVNKIGAGYTKRGMQAPPTQTQANPQTGAPMQTRGLTEDEQSRAAGVGTEPIPEQPGAPAAGGATELGPLPGEPDKRKGTKRTDKFER